jgi:hypothetical protein
MSREARISLINKIEQKRKSKLLAYVTGDRQGVEAHIAPDVLPLLERHLCALLRDNPKQIDLFLYSRGGHSDTPWSIVTLVRELLGDRRFCVLMPSKAHSAATVIAVGADEIVMTPMAELGPIDATISRGPHNPRDPSSGQPLPMSVEDVRGYMDLLDIYRFNDAEERIQAFSHLAKQVPPLGLGAVNRLLSQTRKVAEQLLRMRKEKLGDDDIKRIVDALASGIGSHSHVIRRSEARQIGIKFVINAEDSSINEELLTLFSEYAKMLDLEVPFDGQGELIANDGEEMVWRGLKLATVESTYAQHVFKTDLRVTRLRQVQPQVTVNMPNLQLGVPPLPEGAGIDQQQINEYLNKLLVPVIDAQIAKATDRIGDLLVKSMPQQGFQTVQYNASWQLECTEENVSVLSDPNLEEGNDAEYDRHSTG